MIITILLFPFKRAVSQMQEGGRMAGSFEADCPVLIFQFNQILVCLMQPFAHIIQFLPHHWRLIQAMQPLSQPKRHPVHHFKSIVVTVMHIHVTIKLAAVQRSFMLAKEESDVKALRKVDWTVISGIPNPPNQMFDFASDCILSDVTALTRII